MEDHSSARIPENSGRWGARHATGLALLFLVLMAGVGLSLFFRERAAGLPVEQESSLVGNPQGTLAKADVSLVNGNVPVRTSSEVGTPQGRDSTSLQVDRREEIEESEAQLRILNEVLASKNDNDPRLDQELRFLGPQARAKIRDLYYTLPQERLSEKGTLVFLLGRNLQDEKDFKFIQNVLNEPACLSLENCQRPGGGGAQAVEGERPTPGDGGASVAGHSHDNGVDSVTLIYPQLVAVRTIARLVKEYKVNASNRVWMQRTLEVARNSPVNRVAIEAGAIQLP